MSSYVWNFTLKARKIARKFANEKVSMRLSGAKFLVDAFFCKFSWHFHASENCFLSRYKVHSLLKGRDIESRNRTRFLPQRPKGKKIQRKWEKNDNRMPSLALGNKPHWRGLFSESKIHPLFWRLCKMEQVSLQKAVKVSVKNATFSFPPKLEGNFRWHEVRSGLTGP